MSEMRSRCELARREIEWFALTYSCTKCYLACSKLMARCSQEWWRSGLCCYAGVAKQDIALTLLLLHLVFQRVAINVEPPLNLAPTHSHSIVSVVALVADLSCKSNCDKRSYRIFTYRVSSSTSSTSLLRVSSWSSSSLDIASAKRAFKGIKSVAWNLLHPQKKV